MRKNKIVLIIVFAIITFFVFRYCVFAHFSVVETISSSLLYPLLRIQQLVVEPMSAKIKHRATMHELQDHIQSLQEINEKLLAENIALKGMRSYANETDELRSFNKRYTLRNGCMAQVLARHFSPSNQFFLVDAGTSQGIKKDMVALYCNSIVGRVAEVYPWYCKVCLITDADCKVAAMSTSSFSKKNANGIHEGINDATRTTMRYVSHLESVDVHDTVLSSGEGLVFPKGFALGKIIAADKGELFYTITVEPVLDFKSLGYCILVAKEDIEVKLKQ